MAEKSFTVLDLLEMDLKDLDALNLYCISGRKGLEKVITSPDINRPGLELSGFYDAFDFEKVQVFGKGEAAYLSKLSHGKKVSSIEKFFTYHIPCVVFTDSLVPETEFIKIAERNNCAILQTDLKSSEFTQRILRIFSNVFAKRQTRHGVFVEVYGIGILLLGHAGVGKSECALELVERGHRLVADDSVEMRCINGNTIIGSGKNGLLSYFTEIRGLGIINVKQLYGIGSVLEQKEIQLVIELEDWNSSKNYNILYGEEKLTQEILGVKIPKLVIPVKPGRNIPIIIEAAAKNERLNRVGIDSAKIFQQTILKEIEADYERKPYYRENDY